MLDIITFGSGTRDFYMISPDFRVTGIKKFVRGKGLCLSLGSKIEVENILFKSGGGGTNTAATFANQGFRTAWCGMVGKDFGGQAIIQDLKKIGIDTSFILISSRKHTNYSVVLTTPGEDRTILVYRGASGEVGKRDIPWSRLKAKWFYLAPLSGRLCAVFEDLVNFAHKNKIRVAVNPGNCQLSFPKSILKRIFKKVDVLILNQEEAALLTGVSYQKETDIFRKTNQMIKGIVIMTKGPGGAVVSDGKYIYRAPALLGSRVADRTGAGDAFGSGFISEFIKTNNIEKSIQFATANSSSCLKIWGAKEGLLKKGEGFPRVKVKRDLCSAKICHS
jgi:ribokinase